MTNIKFAERKLLHDISIITCTTYLCSSDIKSN